MIDAGVNLTSNQYKDYIPTLLEHSKEAGLNGWVAISNSYRDWSLNSSIIQEYNTKDFKIGMTCGIHPHNASRVTNTHMEELSQFLESHKDVIAVGECGLDFNRMFSPKDVQLRIFQEQIHIASRFDKPLYLHCRDAHEEFLPLLKQAKQSNPRLQALVHCFTGNATEIKKYVDLGCFIGITPWISDRRRNQELKDAVRFLPPEKIIVETDSPFLIPFEYGRKWNTRRNQPDSIWYVTSELSHILNIKEKDLISQVYKNTTELFPFFRI